MFQKILAAIDNTECSGYLFDSAQRTLRERALSLAKLHQSQLMLVHVLTSGENFYLGSDNLLGLSAPPLPEYLQQIHAWEQQGLSNLKALAADAITAGVPTEFKQPIGNPGKSICDVAKDWSADLIVVGRHGLTGLSEMLVGSESNYVFHHAKCDVLTIQISDRCII
jgi:nucleotide-binding universal stress UspA family protein